MKKKLKGEFISSFFTDSDSGLNKIKTIKFIETYILIMGNYIKVLS